MDEIRTFSLDCELKLPNYGQLIQYSQLASAGLLRWHRDNSKLLQQRQILMNFIMLNNQPCSRIDLQLTSDVTVVSAAVLNIP
jgi:hypothetical protein